jgi:hypothetical protein
VGENSNLKTAKPKPKFQKETDAAHAAMNTDRTMNKQGVLETIPAFTLSITLEVFIGMCAEREDAAWVSASRPLVTVRCGTAHWPAVLEVRSLP